MKSWLSLALLLAAAPLRAESENVAPTPAPAAKAEAKKTPLPSTSEDERLNAVLLGIPAGQVFQGIHIPNIDSSGKLQSLFSAKTAKRIGDREIEMDNLEIEMHNADGTTFHVAMPHAVFNFDTKILTSNTPTTIKRDDMIIHGDQAQFHVKSRFGRVIGNVKMTVFNTGNTP